MSHLDNHFTVLGGESLVKTLIEDLRMVGAANNSIRHDFTPEDQACGGRRVAVIVLYATHQVSVTEGWSVAGIPMPQQLLPLAGEGEP